jgi:tetratricopeptide (TPR) repeat protein
MEKMQKHCFLISLHIVSLLSFNLYAQTPAMNDFKNYYSSGQYAKAIATLEKVSEDETAHGEKFYQLGQCYSKLQEYDKAITNYEKAIKESNDHDDLYYQYGQALYAANELKSSRRAFAESAKRKFNVPASLYYTAHISQILEEFPTAKDNYTDLIKNKEADSKIKQIARFQLAETLLSIMKEKEKSKELLEKGVEKYILPMLKQAQKTDKSTSVSHEIELRIQELEKEYNLDPNLLANGKRISPKRYSGYVVQKIKFDDNITLVNEENNVTQSKKESYIFESEAYAKYDWVIKKRFIVSPEARINFVQNSDQDSPEVFQNDTYSINTNLKNKFEHTIHQAPASFLLDFEYNRNYKDWEKIHKRSHYADAFTIGTGEMFSYFSIGDTSVKAKYKNYKGVNEAISNHTTTFSADQTFLLPNQNLLIALFEADFINNFNNPTTSSNTYLTRFDFLIPDIMPSYTLDVALAGTVTDTKLQKLTRGTEFTLNPSLDLSKQVSEKFKIAVNYDFTKSNSKSPDYKYTKSVFSTEFRYSF